MKYKVSECAQQHNEGTEATMSELQERRTEIIQPERQRKQMNRALEICGTVTEHLHLCHCRPGRTEERGQG